MESSKQIAACQPKILDYNNKHMFEYAGASGGFIDYLGYPYCRGRIFNNIESDQGQYNDSIEIFGPLEHAFVFVLNILKKSMVLTKIFLLTKKK